MCVDTLLAFQEFYSDIPDLPVPPQIPAGYDEVDEEELKRRIKLHVNDSLDDNWNEALCSVMDGFDQFTALEYENKSCSVLGKNGFDGKDVLDAITNKNHQSGCSEKVLSNQKSIQEINETTPENQIIRASDAKKTESPHTVLNKARKALKFNNSKPKNFKLSTIYFHMLGLEAENQHSAEGDCISMLRCVCQIGSHFSEWADCNAVSMNILKT